MVAIAVAAALSFTVQPVPSFAAGGTAGSSASKLAPVVGTLTTELLADPVGVGTAAPRLSWITSSSQRDQVQSAYQVQVSAGLDGFSDRPVWDSGKVRSAEAGLVAYRGKALESGHLYQWRVRVWDSAARLSNWSPTARFGTGLLDSRDWVASWINPAGDPQDGGSYLRSGALELKAAPARAVLYIAARGNYERGNDGQGICCEQDFGLARGIYVPYANGKRVGNAEYESQQVDSRVRAYYRTWDVTTLLRAGTNGIGATIGEDSDVIAQLDVTYPDGTKEQFGTGQAWTSATGPTTRALRYNGESYDARLEQAGWTDPASGGEGWKAVDVVAGDRGALDAAPNEPMRVVKTIKPLSITEPATGVYVLDFGQNISGRARVSATVADGTLVTLKHGERLKDGRVDTSIIGAGQTTRITGNGLPLTYGSAYTYAGFRWVEVSGLTAPPAATTVVAEEIHNDVTAAGTFTSSNELLNKLHVASVQTQRNGLHGVPEDTPTREKRGWMADGYLAAEATMNNNDMSAFYTKWVQDMTDATREDGWVPDIVPNEVGAGWTTRSDPAWAVSTALIPYFQWKYYGNRQLVKSHYAALARWVDYVGTRSDDNLVTRATGGWGNDWVAIESTNGILLRSGFYYLGAKVASEMAAELGHKADEVRFAKLASNIQEAINTKFFDGTASYGGSQFANAFPLVLGIVPADKSEAVVNTLVDNVVNTRGGHFTGGLPGIKYIPEALERYGRSDVVFDVLQKTDYPSWGYMLANGPGTIWEDWGGASSLNHPMFTSIDNWLYTAVAGINQTEDSVGFQHLLFEPKVAGKLDSASATRTTPYGKAAISWSHVGADVKVDVTVPFGSIATVVVPGARAADVTESGRPAADATGVHSIEQSGEDVTIEVGSGSYRLASDRRLGALIDARTAAQGALQVVNDLPISTGASGWQASNRIVVGWPGAKDRMHSPSWPHDAWNGQKPAKAKARLQLAARAVVKDVDKALAAYRKGSAVKTATKALVSARTLVRLVTQFAPPSDWLPDLSGDVVNSLSAYLADVAGVTTSVTVPQNEIDPGGTLDLTVTLTNRSSKSVTGASALVNVDEGWKAELVSGPLPSTIKPKATATALYRIQSTEAGASSDAAVDVVLNFVAKGTKLTRTYEVPLVVNSALRSDGIRVDKAVTEPEGHSYVRAEVANRLLSNSTQATLTVTDLPSGWTAAPPVVQEVPQGSFATVNLRVDAGAEAVSGKARVVVTDAEGVEIANQRIALLVRGSDNCDLDPTGEACLPETTRLVSNFESGTEGWLPGENSSTATAVSSFANGPGVGSIGKHALEVEPEGSPVQSSWRSAGVTFDDPVATHGAYSLLADMDAYGGGGSSTQYRVTVTGEGGAVAETIKTVAPNTWTTVTVPLDELDGAPIASIVTSFRGQGSSAWPGRFQVDGVRLDSSTQSGPNLALGGTVTGSSPINCCGWENSRLTDGIRTSGGGSNGFSSNPARASADYTEWVVADLGSSKEIGEVLLFPRTAQGGESSELTGVNFPVDFTVQTSDDKSTWKAQGSWTGQQADNGSPRIYTLDEGAAGRYLRVHVTKLGRGAPDEQSTAGGGHRLQLAELEAYAPQDPSARILVQPKSLSVAAGTDARFSIAISGKPYPKVTWERKVGDGEFSPLEGSRGSELLLPNVATEADGWKLRVRVESGADVVYSETVTLEVSS